MIIAIQRKNAVFYVDFTSRPFKMQLSRVAQIVQFIVVLPILLQQKAIVLHPTLFSSAMAKAEVT